MAAYITVGAKTTHGGEVITGSPHTTHNGVQVSRKGDKVICKKCKKLTTILTGDPSFIVDGAPIAREGDVTSCGAKLIAIQQSFAESDFEVFGVEQPEPKFEQPAPLQFPKSDPESLFASLKNTENEEKPEKVHFAIEVVEFNSDGDYLDSYDLADNPSGLLAADSTWYKEEGFGNQISTLGKDTYELLVNQVTSYFEGAQTKGKELVKNTVDPFKNPRSIAPITLGILEEGIKTFPQRTRASAATAMLQFGQRTDVDFVYIAGGGGVKHFAIETSMAVNAHNGRVYEPVAANASVNTNKAPSIGVQIGVGRIIDRSGESRANATDIILSGQGHSYSVEFGPASTAFETTHDGKITGGVISAGKHLSFGGNKNSSSIGVSKSSTNMEEATEMKYKAAKNIIEYVGK